MAVESYRQITGREPMTPQPQHCDEKFRELAEEWLSTYGGLSETSLTYAVNDFAEMARVAYNTNNHSAASRPAPSPCVQCLEEDRVSMMEHDAAIAAQARDKLFEAIRAERDPHLDYVDWDSIEAAYIRTGGEP